MPAIVRKVFIKSFLSDCLPGADTSNFGRQPRIIVFASYFIVTIPLSSAPPKLASPLQLGASR